MTIKSPPRRPGRRLVCRQWITVKGRRIYRKNGQPFCFWVDE